MNVSRVSELSAGFQRLHMTPNKGTRMCNTVTLSSTEAKPGEDIYVYIPKLGPNTVLIPDTLQLSFKFESANAKSTFTNNLGKGLCKELLIKMGGEIVYNNTGEAIIETYRDLWLPEHVRENMYEYGIVPDEDFRKKFSGNDTPTSKYDAIAECVPRQKIKLGRILKDHGPFAPFVIT